MSTVLRHSQPSTEPLNTVGRVRLYKCFNLQPYRVWHVPCLTPTAREHMLRISTIESSSQCRLVLEGKLISPWVGELKTTCEKARAELHGRKLVVDIKYLVSISREGENVLLQLMDEGVMLRGCGLFTKHILKQLAQKKRRNHREST